MLCVAFRPIGDLAGWWARWGVLPLLALACGGLGRLAKALGDQWARDEPMGTVGPVLVLARGADLGMQARLAVGQAGEAHVRALLAAGLPTGTWVLNNLQLPGLGGDIDLLVIGGTGAFLPEVKTWSGAIECGADGHTWRRLRAGRWEDLPDPVAQTEREVGALRRYLERADPELCRRTGLWIEPLLVFAHPNSRLDGRRSPIASLRRRRRWRRSGRRCRGARLGRSIRSDWSRLWPPPSRILEWSDGCGLAWGRRSSPPLDDPGPHGGGTGACWQPNRGRRSG